jgi:hypothetical protein
VDLICDLLILSFFGRGELLVCHYELYRFVSGSYWKITCYDMSEKKIVFFDAFKKVLRFSFCSLVSFFGTSFAQIFYMPTSSVKMWTVR